MSSPQGRPHAVYSMLKLLGAVGPMDAATLAAWMVPDTPRGGSNLRLLATADCASSLGFIQKSGDSWVLSVAAPDSFETFLDQVHTRLCRSDSADQDVLSAFAAVVAMCERSEGTGWLRVSPDHFSAEVRAAMPEGQSFNKDRLSAWRDWVCALGLGYDNNPALGVFYPRLTGRLRRVLRAAVDFEGAAEIDAESFLRAIARAMPYVEGGGLWDTAATTLKLAPQRRISVCLSEALRDLHLNGEVELLHRGGDHRGVKRLAHGRGPEAFEAVRIHV